MVRQGKSSTRNTDFNYYESSVGYINSIADYKAAKNTENITLIESDDYIVKSGVVIDNDAKKNTNCNKYIGKEVNIVTGLEDDTNLYYIYGSPDRWVLDNRQQYNNCGVDSILNVLVIAGKKIITNQNKTEKTFTKDLWDRGLVQDDGKLGVFDTHDGGTRITDYRDILKEFGISSEAYTSLYFASSTPDGYSTTLSDVADVVKNGGSAILAVSSYLLWQEYKKGTDNKTTEYQIDTSECILDHAITVTGVVYDADNNLTGFYIHDTGIWMTRYISLEEMVLVTLEDQTNSTWKEDTGVFGTIISDDIKSWINDINATGNNLANTITGNSGNNIIKGMGGDDTLVGKAGNDKIYGGAGNDYIYGNDKDIEGGSTSGNNILYGDAGIDHIYGGNYNDVIYGGNDNDWLYGNDGIDVIYGGKGNDWIYGGYGDDRLLGEAGNDIIYGGDGDDVIVGGAGNDTINGGTGFDKIDCGSGDDRIIFNAICQEDTFTSSSGSVVLKFADDSAKNLLYGLEGNSFMAGYNNYTELTGFNMVTYTNFYNSKKNSYQKAFLEDSNNTQYRISATKSRGNIKVADAANNNIFFSLSNSNNTITTSTNNDIVFMYNGDDIITYTGGHDYYYSSFGDDKYDVSLFNSITHLIITDDFDLDEDYDDPSEDDLLYIEASAEKIIPLFDITKNGDIYKNNDLFLIYDDNNTKDKLASIINDNDKTGGFIQVTDYFGMGNIETILAKEKYYEINIEAIKSEVASWFETYGTTYGATVFESINNETITTEALSALVDAYSLKNIQNI